MKYYFITFLFILFVPNISFAQFSNDCLGIWCTIDVDLNQQKNDLVYTIPVPPEGILLTTPNVFGTVGPIIQGPGSPHLFNNLGNTVDLHLRKNHLLLEYENNPTECVLELIVNKKVSDWGTSSPAQNFCYYYIRLLLSK